MLVFFLLVNLQSTSADPQSQNPACPAASFFFAVSGDSFVKVEKMVFKEQKMFCCPTKHLHQLFWSTGKNIMYHLKVSVMPELLPVEQTVIMKELFLGKSFLFVCL